MSQSLLEERLDDILDPVLSSRRTAMQLAVAAARLPRDQQEFVLHWTTVIARTNPEMAYQFAAAAPQALDSLDSDTAEAWIIRAMDVYDREGLYRGSQVLKNVDAFVQLAGDSGAAVAFESVAQVLQYYACGLSGRRMRLETATRPYTDSETIFLPSRIGIALNKNDNFLFYKIILTMLWAQGQYGTFDADLGAACAAYDDPRRALDTLNYLETVRLEARITRALPGLARDMARLRGSEAPQSIRAPLSRATATIHDSLALLPGLYSNLTPPECGYTTELRPDEVAVATRNRIAREKLALQAALDGMLKDKEAEPREGKPQQPGRFSVSVDRDVDIDSRFHYELMLDHRPVTPPDEVRRLLDSILQDLGDIPDDYLSTAGDDVYRTFSTAEHVAPDMWKDVYREDTVFLYNEWDHRRRHYRKNWCVLRELDVHPGQDGFVDTTLLKYGPQIAQLKRTFELLRGDDRLLRRQAHGDDIDLDAVICAYADMKNGMELSDRLLVRRHKSERNLAVMFMVDMSGSTKGWINDAEREALVMLCEALDVLGDRYAIYGFSGMTRKRCEIFRVKRFDEPYDATVKSRIAGITPQDYTRMGVAIRHLTHLLAEIEARSKLLVALSDGKPDDYSDNYRGEYGIEDTRQALIEAHRSGVKPFCITIDREARDYLPYMYGAVNWALVDDIARLPLKVADIYRRLTT